MTTQKVYCSYDEILDLKTSEKQVTVVGIHTPTGNTPHRLFPGFWRQYQKVKYLGASLSLIPAARLPADISQVGYEGGAEPIDMRDLLNPILWHGCHGESLGAALNQFMNGGSTQNDMVSNDFQTPSVDLFNTQSFASSNYQFGDAFEDLYYKALTDRTWAKAHPQRGFRKSGLRPLVYDLAVNMQITNTESVTGNSPRVADYDGYQTIYDNPTSYTYGSGGLGPQSGTGAGTTTFAAAQLRSAYPIDGIHMTTGSVPEAQTVYSNNKVQFVTNRLRSLGWLDTYNRYGYMPTTAGISDSMETLMYRLQDESEVASLPYLMMGIILLPPSYLAEQYFRLCIHHNFAFCKYRGFSMSNTEQLDSNRTTFNAIPKLQPNANNSKEDVKDAGESDTGKEETGDNPIV